MLAIVTLDVLLQVGVCFLVWLLFIEKKKSKKQYHVSKSFTESKYRAMSQAYAEIYWLRGLLVELDFSSYSHTSLHMDNTSAFHISSNLTFHECTKHIEVDCHFIHEAFEARTFSLPYVFRNLQVADIFTKILT